MPSLFPSFPLSLSPSISLTPSLPSLLRHVMTAGQTREDQDDDDDDVQYSMIASVGRKNSCPHLRRRRVTR